MIVTMTTRSEARLIPTSRSILRKPITLQLPSQQNYGLAVPHGMLSRARIVMLMMMMMVTVM